MPIVVSTDSQQLVSKYNLTVPRYTSYPTHPTWRNNVSAGKALDIIKQENPEEISIYIHLPFCEDLCTYCGCNTRITKNHAVEEVYINFLLKEAAMYSSHITGQVKELHFGGGTPTFFSPDNLTVLMTGLGKLFKLATKGYSLECHPAHTTKEHLSVLKSFGFSRVSIGVQDTSPTVLEAINRNQTVNQVRDLAAYAGELGYAINFDLVYGLPFQTLKNMDDSIDLVNEIKPSRIAWYSYAHIPWKKPGQRGYSESDLPNAVQKLDMWKHLSKGLKQAGYTAIGFDHFALPTDSLYAAFSSGKLYRNFMGYTEFHTDALLGLGASSISEFKGAFWQNEKKNENYYTVLKEGKLPIVNGHIITPREQVTKAKILDLLCYRSTDVHCCFEADLSIDKQELLNELINDEMVRLTQDKLIVTEQGRAFMRLAACLLDPEFSLNNSELRFSSSI
ncbi:MAG: oxygen-independent coproporphyrinogen III oxidase [Flavobacteriales bacterium]